MENSGMNAGAMHFGGKLRVEGIQTVVPTEPTDPRQSSRITVSSSAAVLQRRFHVLLCYNKASDEDSGWLVAGRIKDSLGRALQEQPLLAGRLRRREGSTDADLEIVSNDSGVRLVETKAEMELGGFVEMKEKKKAEAELHFWEDVVHHKPQFSPLFYVQVTNFKCGGYSIGISCSLLLTDPFALTTFIKKWANVHNSLLSRNDKIPTFYLPNHGKPASSPSLLMGSNTTKDAAESFIFTIPIKILSSDSNTIHKDLAAFCIEEAERDAGRKLASNLSLFLKMPFEDDRMEVWSREELLGCSKSRDGVKGMRYARTWDELELDSICFSEGNKPIYASCWINSVVDQGSVMINVPTTHDSGVKIVVTFT